MMMMMMMMMAMMTMINNDNDNLEEGEFLYQKAPEKIQAPGKNRTHDPSSFSSDAPTTELLYWRLYGVQVQNLIITTPVKEDRIGELLEIGRPPA